MAARGRCCTVTWTGYLEERAWQAAGTVLRLEVCVGGSRGCWPVWRQCGGLTLVAQVGVCHELVDHQVHLAQLPWAEVLTASFVLQED